METVQKLIVEVVEARNLLPKDGTGTSSPYVVIDFDGQRKRTHTVHRELNPTWNEVLEFGVDREPDKAGDALEIDVFHDRKAAPSRRNNFLGRVRLKPAQFVCKGEEALVHYPLERKSFFSWIRGDIGLKIYYVNEVIPLPPPPTPPPAQEDARKAEMQAAPPEEASPAPAEPTPSTDAENSNEPPKPNEPPAPAAENPEEQGAAAPAETAAAADEATPPPPPLPPEENVEKQEETATAAQPESGAADPQAPSEKQPCQPDAEGVASAAPDAMFEVNPKGKMAEPNMGQRPPLMSDIYPREAADRYYGCVSSRERSTYDLVEKMHYLFVRVVKARSLPVDANPFVKITVSGCNIRTKPARKTSLQFEWDQTFAFGRDAHGSSSTLEVSVWDSRPGSAPPTPKSDAGGERFFGGICFDVSEIMLRDPPDSPLAPQWFRLEGGGAHRSDLMLATWIGTQADESFSDAWKTDTSGAVTSRAKVYLSPKLWYLRATILEAQDIQTCTPLKETSLSVKAQLGFQMLRTRSAVNRNACPSWNEDLILVAAEPFGEEHRLVFILENRFGKDSVVLGVAGIPLTSIERRVDDRKVVSRWITLEGSAKDKKDSYNGRLHVRICFDGGYHVADEPAHVSSDFRPSARQLWKPPIGTVELGIIGCRSLLPVKTVAGRGTADAYAVAKYGEKWVRSRTVGNSLEPRWNEQYSWHVYDPCTALTVGVFDSVDESKDASRQDLRIGKLRIRISTLENNRVYKNAYPLLLLLPTGVKRMGEIELAVRFARAVPRFDIAHVYTQPILPRMHYLKPIGAMQQEALRATAARVVAMRLAQSEPQLRREVVIHMLDADSPAFSMRKVRANWVRIMSLLAGVGEMARWVEDVRAWKNTTAALITHVLLVLLVWHPDLVVPTLALYTCGAGAWNYRSRRRDPKPHPCVKLSQAEVVDREELDEEFDPIPSSRAAETVRVRYDRLRTVGARIQTVLGDIATQGERLQALVTWRDPRATGIFILVCFMVSAVLYAVPSKLVAVAGGFYFLRHPMFRDRMPAPAVNFFRRLPSLSDRLM